VATLRTDAADKANGVLQKLLTEIVPKPDSPANERSQADRQ
jgi:hypothetical protein